MDVSTVSVVNAAFGMKPVLVYKENTIKKESISSPFLNPKLLIKEQLL